MRLECPTRSVPAAADRAGVVSIPAGAFMKVVLEDDEFRRTTLRTVSLQVVQGLTRGLSLGDAARCALRQVPEGERYFHLPASADGADFGLRAEYLFPARNPRVSALKFLSPNPQGGGMTRLQFEPAEEEIPQCGDLLTGGASGTLTAAALAGSLASPLSDLALALLADGFFTPGRCGEPAALDRLGSSGVHRLQHACLLFRSGGRGVLVDPHVHSAYAPRDVTDSFSRADLAGLVDVILLSHSHGDHYDLSSLLSFPRDTPVIVPRVPRPSLVCEDVAGRLRSLGFTTVVDAEWYGEPIEAGGFTIRPLPFFGEQPLLSEWPRDRDLRNWGNTYVIEAEDYRAWVLIDSGNDAAGRMASVAERIVDTLGPVDLVLSNLREFAVHTPTYITGDGAYWACLTADQMRRFPGMRRDLITLGAVGVAELCHITRATSFLPYAHWWANRGQRPKGEGPLCERLARALRERGAATTIVPWVIGGGWSPRLEEGGDLRFA
jgi:L-ascorbate metabolism protein UlaG (beta-lactamase superfamily)